LQMAGEPSAQEHPGDIAELFGRAARTRQARARPSLEGRVCSRNALMTPM
jgi:hypothetical protein